MKKTVGRVLGVLVFLALVFAPIDQTVLPTSARYVAAVTLLMIIWWITEAVPLEATALLPVVLFPALGVLTPTEATAPYADKVIFLFMGGFIIAMSMQRWGLHRRIALNIIKVVGTSPRRLILGFMIATAFLSMWISNTATAMMMIPIAIAIITTVIPNASTLLKDMTPEQRDFSEAIVISIAYAANIGGIATLIGTPPNGIFAAQMKALFPAAPAIDFFSWMKFGVPLVMIFIPLTWLWLTYGSYRHLPTKVAHAGDIIDHQMEDLGRMSRGERWTLMVFVLTALAWIFAKTKYIGDFTIPGLDMFFPGIHDSTIAIAGALLLFLLPVDRKKGIYTMDWEWAVKIPWGILILFGGGICLSVAFIKSGLANVIVDQLAMFGGLPIVLIVLIVGIAVSLLTEVTSNTAMASLMMPIMAVTSVSMGIHPYMLMLTVAVCTSMAFMLPVATPPNAVAYASGYIDMKDLMRSGWVLNFIGVGLWTFFIFTVVMWALGFTPALPDWATMPVK
ncbi:DASS family sodium-coupled anion symporter [Methanofollis formosanus]|uniref:DASS family sodium-coupled anion symporter n=1 Tax=Methanofollis formosanus TaxID=299308 RepID=A0A8G1EGR2_9EURY|nr:DASS family sodium-coupled anion symporter [Methanofollis formosanus]QYZ79411.1 DASS family sodium-coupled anion symporter [Methanofollis formosanus]